MELWCVRLFRTVADLIFIREGDYIIKEKDDERHVCGADKFSERYLEMQ